MNPNFELALSLVEKKLEKIRSEVPPRIFDARKPAEIEANKFWYEGATIDRLMVVLRSTGCSHYRTRKGCSMCGHYDGTTEKPVSAEEYITQWKSVLDGKSLENRIDFDVNSFPVLCLYNLGSFLNPNEVPLEAVSGIFSSIAHLTGIKKTIIESRAEYVTPEILKSIRSVYPGIVEVGMGLESVNYEIRELCHHKNMPDLKVFEDAIKCLHNHGCKALAYVNQKPPFLTEKEAMDDTIETSLYAFKAGVDAVSIEPTSLQAHSLTDYLYQIGLYTVPWLWSVIQAVKEIYAKSQPNSLDLRLGGYFEDTVLSGSQGFAPGRSKNELFPHKTAGNCASCTQRIVEAMKEFNRSYDQRTIANAKQCPNCYHMWLESIGVTDSRPIVQRIIDMLK